MLQTLQIISLVVGIPSTAIVLLTSVCKPFRAWLFGRYRGQETDRCLLRDRITEIYYKHYQERRMRLAITHIDTSVVERRHFLLLIE